MQSDVLATAVAQDTQLSKTQVSTTAVRSQLCICLLFFMVCSLHQQSIDTCLSVQLTVSAACIGACESQEAEKEQA